MKKHVLFSLLILLLVLSVTACGSAQRSDTKAEKKEIPDLEAVMTLDEYPSCDGSPLALPMSEAVCCALTGAERSAVCNKIVHNGKESALNSLFGGKTDIVFVEGDDASLNTEAEKAGVKIELFPVAREYYAFYSKAELTDEEKSKLLSDDGLEAGSSENNISAQTASAIIEGGLKCSINYAKGYFISGYTPEGVVIYTVNGVAPDRDTIISEEYPYSFCYYAIIRADSPAGSSERAVAEALAGESGQKLLEETGYVRY